MEKDNSKVRDISRFVTVAIASVLFGSTMILSAVGPARASETQALASHGGPAALRYLA